MSCACSRQRHKAELKGNLDVTLRCLPNGNYEELQCTNGICWCADEIDGHILKKTFAVPEALWTYLPCCRYDLIIMQSFNLPFLDNSSHHGDQYLRKCESAAHAQMMIQKKLINRGAVNAFPFQIRCNYDGSYGDVVIENPV